MMKKLHIAFVVAVLISGLFAGQISAATAPSAAAASTCGKTYTVVGGDNLTRIASKCNVSLSDILSWNPAITNANLIYVGQVLSLNGPASTATATPGSGSSSGNTSYSGSSYITISATTAEAGDSIVVKAFKFPANADLDFRLYRKGSNELYTVIDAKADGNGSAQKTIKIPGGAGNGSQWVIRVLTTDRYPETNISSPTITVGSTSGSSSYSGAEVTVDKTDVAIGGQLSVSVTGFPANADIDYCVRKRGTTNCVNVYDGTTNKNGNASRNVNIPGSAATNETWVVEVHTTERATVISATSARITVH